MKLFMTLLDKKEDDYENRLSRSFSEMSRVLKKIKT